MCIKGLIHAIKGKFGFLRHAHYAYVRSCETWGYMAEPCWFSWPGAVFAHHGMCDAGTPIDHSITDSVKCRGTETIPRPRRSVECGTGSWEK